jgi:hypothetical protein
MTRLTDHRRFGRTTMLVIAAAALLLTGVLAAAGRESAISGVLAGSLIAEIDAWLLARGLSRFADHSDRVGARALTVLMLGRFALIGAMVGVVLSAQGFDPFGVVAGFLLFPMAIVAVGIASLRADHHQGVNGAAR